MGVSNSKGTYLTQSLFELRAKKLSESGGNPHTFVQYFYDYQFYHFTFQLIIILTIFLKKKKIHRETSWLQSWSVVDVHPLITLKVLLKPIQQFWRDLRRVEPKCRQEGTRRDSKEK